MIYWLQNFGNAFLYHIYEVCENHSIIKLSVSVYNVYEPNTLYMRRFGEYTSDKHNILVALDAFQLHQRFTNNKNDNTKQNIYIL